MIPSLTVPALQAAYRSGALTPGRLVEQLLQRSGESGGHAIWISPPDAVRLRERARELERIGMQGLALYGVPFAIKDNIDLAGVPTTAGCPEFAYTPRESAAVVQRLLDAGAIAVGKTNLDQFATGLNGTRSPYGACRNAFDSAYVSGGSSSGSAVAVALGLASFSLGTDTAGSGRVPAAFNNLVGLKPSCGLLSTHGIVPACRSLDVPSIFALSATDAQRVFAVALGDDPRDPYSRPAEPHGFDFGSAASFRFGVPMARNLQFFGDADSEALFADAVQRLRGLGGEAVTVDLEPFFETARLLYEGPWVAERYQALRDFVDNHPKALLPVTLDIIGGAARWLAADAFAAQYRLRELQRVCSRTWEQVDCMLTPTAGTIFTIEQMLAEPVARNSDLGLYTNFMKLLDYAAVAVPAGLRDDGLPFGATLFAPAHQDLPLLRLAARWQRDRARPCGAREAFPAPPDPDVPSPVPSGWMRLVVVGAHLRGMPLNRELTDRGGRLEASTHTASCYRLHALADGRRPALLRVATGGVSIACEVWELPVRSLGGLLAGVAEPLGLGSVLLADGTSAAGFICEAGGLEGARDITEFGGWRAWVAASAPS